MKNLYFFIFFFINLTLIYSQNKNFTLFDSISKKAIPFATIKLLDTNKGVYSNKNGVFVIIPKDSMYIEIQHINYNNKIINSALLKDSIFMSPKIEKLNEIILTTKKGKEKYLIGNLKTRTKIRQRLLTGFEFCIKLKNDSGKDLILNKLILKCSNRKPNDNTDIFRVKFYKSIFLQEKPFYSEIISINKIKKKQIEFHLINNIVINSNDEIYVGIEYIGIVDNSGRFIQKSNTSSTVALMFTSTLKGQPKTYDKFFFSKQEPKLITNNNAYYESLYHMKIIKNKKTIINLALSFEGFENE